MDVDRFGQMLKRVSKKMYSGAACVENTSFFLSGHVLLVEIVIAVNSTDFAFPHYLMTNLRILVGVRTSL